MAKQVRDDSAEDARRRYRRLDQRPQLPDQRGAVELGRRIRHPEAVGRAAAASRTRRSIVAAVRAEAAADSGRVRAELRSALDPGPRHHRRLRIPGRGPHRPRQRRAQRGDAGADRGSAQAAGAQRRSSCSRRSAPRRRSSTTTSIATRRSCSGLNLPDVFNTLQIYLGSLYVNDFNLFGRTFRVTLQADKDARADADRPLAALCAQRLGRHGAAQHAWHAASRSSGRRPCRTTTTMPRR